MAKATPVQTAPPNDGDTAETPLQRFSRALAARYPGRMIQQFTMPTAVRECREVFLLEITSRDEIEAAIMADATMSNLEKASQRLAMDAERREVIRLSMVGIGEQLGGRDAKATDEIVYRHTNHDGAPLSEINDWSGKAWSSLHAYFGQLNGVPVDEIRSGLQEARIVGAFAPPTSATPASAVGGK